MIHRNTSEIIQIASYLIKQLRNILSFYQGPLKASYNSNFGFISSDKLLHIGEKLKNQKNK